METPSTECSIDSDAGSLLGSTDALDQKGKEVLQSPLYEDKKLWISFSSLQIIGLKYEGGIKCCWESPKLFLGSILHYISFICGAKGNGRGLNGKDSCEKEEGILSDEDDEDDEDAVACDLDMHSLILSGLRQGAEEEDETPLKTADEVIREIDDMMQPSKIANELKALSVSQLNDIYLELEVLIREFSETLISELALRDELEYEKELKNTFISLLLAVQNRRRQFHVERKRNSRSTKPPATANGLDPKVNY
ncbi:hypothetical protein J437_LFUL009924 [Ladona fulva]|uniref:Fasciculation and elongation protein zeta-2 n=1 Tax=Ladona fulva TaxID=123851 RepID=A0A8K0KI08_LADFU|nr:hypothetical protein J437_LFUL009924 [Ladona fulva]